MEAWVDLKNGSPIYQLSVEEGYDSLSEWESTLEFLPDTSQPNLFIFQEEEVIVIVYNDSCPTKLLTNAKSCSLLEQVLRLSNQVSPGIKLD